VKRGALFALLALLALLVVSSATAAVIAGPTTGAQASKKGKKKGCKKKGKAKSRTSAAASAKKKKCKPKGKKPQATPSPVGATPQPAAPAPTWPLVDGVYTDRADTGTTLRLSGNASSASVIFGAAGSFCAVNFMTGQQPVTMTATTLTTGGEEKFTSVGSNFTVKWSLSVASDLSYVLTVDSKNEGGPIPPCDKPGVVVKGTLYKIG
jgi:hypothetical protein